ncbi:hypothetical protein EZMO1_1988 [Endozoicomonas montiporae CL-33]|uniref:Uncharacterized protein n=1 Tax=Endozoicomonas montiporae CL-33 TaxID=570277 RepID=A0A142BBI5_9GAMM|nr:hypothetical protein EZMO1_1988 [Endozoicomonas montiporae CL-33]
MDFSLVVFWVRYRHKQNDQEFVTGENPDAFTSADIKNTEDKSLLTDERIQTLKSEFNATIKPANKDMP